MGGGLPQWVDSFRDPAVVGAVPDKPHLVVGGATIPGFLSLRTGKCAPIRAPAPVDERDNFAKVPMPSFGR
jgi:hypothetical protein